MKTVTCQGLGHELIKGLSALFVCTNRSQACEADCLAQDRKEMPSQFKYKTKCTLVFFLPMGLWSKTLWCYQSQMGPNIHVMIILPARSINSGANRCGKTCNIAILWRVFKMLHTVNTMFPKRLIKDEHFSSSRTETPRLQWCKDRSGSGFCGYYRH